MSVNELIALLDIIENRRVKLDLEVEKKVYKPHQHRSLLRIVRITYPKSDNRNFFIIENRYFQFIHKCLKNSYVRFDRTAL